MMDNMMSNPEMMEMVMNMNPQLRDLVERNPQIRQMMMRNADRAMSNLETVPGGMDALRRLHNDIQDPLWDAMAGQEGSAATPQTYATQDTSQAPSAAAMPN